MPMNQVARNIEQAADLIKKANDILAQIVRSWADPPEPDKPAIRAAANDVKTSAAASTNLADSIIAKL